MKTLTLLRHAKSGWDDTVPRDFDRPLNDKGRRAARTVGRHLRDAGFDHVVASPARRVAETLAEVEAGLGRPLSPAWDNRLYLASAAALIEVVRELPATAAHALLVGHNPGLEDLVLELVPNGDATRGVVELKYPTAAIAELSWPGEWTAIRPGGATLVRFVRPRDLDPALGPEQV